MYNLKSVDNKHMIVFDEQCASQQITKRTLRGFVQLARNPLAFLFHIFLQNKSVTSVNHTCTCKRDFVFLLNACNTIGLWCNQKVAAIHCWSFEKFMDDIQATPLQSTCVNICTNLTPYGIVEKSLTQAQ